MKTKIENKETGFMVYGVIGLIKNMLKTYGNEAKTHRQARILLIVLLSVLIQFSGCLPGPSSPLTQLASEPPGFPQIRLDKNVCPSERLYNCLIKTGKGKIGPHEHADYIITRLEFDSDIEISFLKASYRLYCEVSDNYNEKVIESFTNRVVKGRFEAGTDYSDTVSTRRYEEFIAEDAANRLINDLYKKMPAVVAAEPQRLRKTAEKIK